MQAEQSVARSSKPQSSFRRKRARKTGLTYFALILFSLYFLLPFVWMLSVSLQTEAEMMTSAGGLNRLIPESWRFENYRDVFIQVPFARYFVNSGIVTLSTVAGTLLSSSLVAYSFAKLKWPGRKLAYSVMLATMMLPATVLMIPTYKMYSYMGFVDSFVPLILPAWLGGGAGNIILIEQFFRTVPKEINDAAKIDGANYFMIWARIMLPMCLPVLATVGVFAFLFSWNDYLGPLIYLHSADKTTVALGLRAFQSQQSTNWPLLMAGSVISMIPNILVFIFGQRFFVGGIRSGAVKG